MTRWWARGPGGGAWHYFPRPILFDRLVVEAACQEALIDTGDFESVIDEPGREIPDPACRTCWLARQAVEAYRRSLVPDPAQVATIQRITQDLENVRRVSFGLNDDVLRLQRDAAELAQAIAYREAP